MTNMILDLYQDSRFHFINFFLMKFFVSQYDNGTFRLKTQFLPMNVLYRIFEQNLYKNIEIPILPFTLGHRSFSSSRLHLLPLPSAATTEPAKTTGTTTTPTTLRLGAL